MYTKTFLYYQLVHNKLKCLYCNKEFRTKQARTNHVNKNHRNEANEKNKEDCTTSVQNDLSSNKAENSIGEDAALPKINLKSCYDRVPLPNISFYQQNSPDKEGELNKFVPNGKNRKSVLSYFDKKLAENKLKNEAASLYKNSSFQIFDEEKKKFNLFTPVLSKDVGRVYDSGSFVWFYYSS